MPLTLKRRSIFMTGPKECSSAGFRPCVLLGFAEGRGISEAHPKGRHPGIPQEEGWSNTAGVSGKGAAGKGLGRWWGGRLQQDPGGETRHQTSRLMRRAEIAVVLGLPTNRPRFSATWCSATDLMSHSTTLYSHLYYALGMLYLLSSIIHL